MTETKDLETALYLIERDCQPFFSQSGGGLIYRGIRGVDDYACVSPDIHYRQPVRKNRKSKNLPEAVHKILVRIFKELSFKANRDNVSFSASRTNAKKHGDAYIFFPIGEFDYTWSGDVGDLNDELKAFKADDGDGWIDRGIFEFKDENSVTESECDDCSIVKMLSFITLFELYEHQIINFNYQKFKEHLGTIYLNSADLVRAIESGNEIGIACEECYYMPVKHEEDVRGLRAS